MVFDSVPISMSLIAVLLRSRCPLAIGRFVMPVVVDSFETQPWRALAHVLYKILERLSPSFTNGNSSAAIVLVAFQVLISASLNHTKPRLISPRWQCSVRSGVMAMLELPGSNHLTLQTPA